METQNFTSQVQPDYDDWLSSLHSLQDVCEDMKHEADTHNEDSPECREYYFFDSPACSQVQCSDGTCLEKDEFLTLIDTGKMIFVRYQERLLGKHHYKPQSVSVFHRQFATLEEMQDLVRNTARSLSEIARINKQNKRLLTQEWVLEERALERRLNVQKATLLYLQQHPFQTATHQTLQPEQEKASDIERLFGVFEQLSWKKHIGAAYKVARRNWEQHHNVKEIMDFAREIHDVFQIAQEEGIYA